MAWNFDWDLWNVQKNEIKHGVSPQEAESVFYDEKHLLFEDEIHSSHEKRFILLGKGMESRVLFVGFTVRSKKIRIITARTASKREREVYEKQKK